MKLTAPLRALRLSTALLLAAVLASCATAPASTPALVPAPKPKLLVFLVVDGLPERQITGYRDQLAPDGFARFLDHGVWFTDAHYGQSFTVTCAGHATMLTGAYPHRSGVIANDWRDAATGAPEYCAGDTTASYIGNATKPLDGTSPKNLKVESVGDVLKRVSPRSKVIAVSGKDRGAIMPAGKTGTAYMYMAQSGQFASSTYYMQQHPAWVNEFNGRKLADGYFKTQWLPLLPDAAYARSLPDNQPWFGPKGGALPMTMGAATDAVPTPAFYGQLLRSPFVDALSLQFARAAIAGEGLGQDDAPDILIVSLSGHDYVNHAYSAESRLSHDHLLQLDRLLQDFLRDLDANIGPYNYVAMLTADHGFMPAPEYSEQIGLASGRINGAQALGRVNAGLEARFGPGRWISPSGSSLLLNKQLVAQKQADANLLAETARSLLLAEPGVAAAYTRSELQSGSRAGAPFFEQMRKSWHPDVWGDVQFVLKPYWMFASSTAVTTHGSPYPYDTNVPILMYGPRWMQHSRVESRVEVVDIAPTVARLLGVPAPAASEGKPLPLLAP
jgi:predicted AlkP superfamily pyrophosphatase or phosphodiesterase